MEQIRLGFEIGLSQNQIDYYSAVNTEGLPQEQIDYYAALNKEGQPIYKGYQMEFMCKGFKSGLTINQIEIDHNLIEQDINNLEYKLLCPEPINF